MPHRAFSISDIGDITVYKRRGNRSMRLTITADGEIRVTMPPWMPYQAALDFVHSRQAWILAQQPRHAMQILKHGQQIGKAHHLFFRTHQDSGLISANVRGSIITVHHPIFIAYDDAKVQAAATTASIRALRLQATELLNKRLEQLAALHDMPYRSVRIKRMKTRWGSCDQQSNIVLNLFLVQLPWIYIDYVILHELAHTKALHHGPMFWNVFEDLLPDARQLKKGMRAYQPTVFVAQPKADVA